jgi:hypothetical protein
VWETYTWEDLLAALQQSNPVKVDALHRHRRRVEHGLLSVGLKLHCLTPEYPELQRLVQEVGGFEQRPYRRESASLTYVLPPVGSARMAVMLLECIEEFTGYNIFKNKAVQIQVCSPCRLDRDNAAVLALVFCLGSDVLRHYRLADFATTFSTPDENKHHSLVRGRRIVLYDGLGTLDREFDWWDLQGDGSLVVRKDLPFKSARTDILTALTKTDIYNINLASSLLVHYQQVAYWEDVGLRFKQAVAALLHEHALDAVLEAPWVHDEGADVQDDYAFYFILNEVMNYARAEKDRLKKERSAFWRRKALRPGILGQMRALLGQFSTEVVKHAQQLPKEES